MIGSFDVENPFMGSFGSNFDQNPLGGIIRRNCPEVPSDLLRKVHIMRRKMERAYFNHQARDTRQDSNLRSPPGSQLMRMRIDMHVWHALTLKNRMHLWSKAKLSR